MVPTDPFDDALAACENLATMTGNVSAALAAGAANLRAVRREFERLDPAAMAALAPHVAPLVPVLRRVRASAEDLADKVLPEYVGEVEAFRRLLARRVAAAQGLAGGK